MPFEKVKSDFVTTTHAHSCCLNCRVKCECCGEGSGCSNPISNFGTSDSHVKDKFWASRSMRRKPKNLLKQLLVDYQKAKVTGVLACLNPEGTCGFTNSLVNAVVKHSKFMFSMDYILTNLPMFKTQRVLDILHMFQDLFEDIFPF